MADGFRYGLVIKNSGVQHFVVMVVSVLPDWQYRPGYEPVPRAVAMVVSDGSRYGAAKTGDVIEISGGIGRDGWLVVG